MTPDSELVAIRARAMEFAHTGIVITDARQTGNPIIDCNPAFEVITGYAREEVLGKNPRFLQGPDTDPAAVSAIRAAMQEQRQLTIVIKNYHKDGTMFWNEMFIAPVYDDDGQLTHHIGIQNNVTVRETARSEAANKNAELDRINQELSNKAQQQKDIDKRINDLLRQSHSHLD